MQKEIVTKTRKENTLRALEKCLGIVSTACKEVGVTRKTFYEWCRNDEEFKKQVDAIDEVVLDFAESCLYKLVKEGNPTATIFLLKCKGKKRGYIERVEIQKSNDSDTIIWQENKTYVKEE